MNYIITHLTSAETFAITIAKLCNNNTVYSRQLKATGTIKIKI